jgi:pimeloyl-ACP methyl ester carboxylesterase
MRYTGFIACFFLLSSCLKLDTNLYNANNSIKEYALDNYNDVQDFRLDGSYDIPSNLVTVFTLSSRTKNENEPVNIKAMYIGNIQNIATDTVILYCHGNKWHMDFYWQRAKLLAHVNGKNRYGVMMMDYRGYGLSEGEPTEEGMYADVTACMQWLADRGLKGQRLVMYGFSMGSAPACKLTANLTVMPASKLILEAPFASAAVMVQDASQMNMPAEYFTRLQINNAEEVKKIEQPLLWLHGTNDNFLNYKTHGQLVFENYNGKYSEKFLVEGADHGEIPAKAGFEKYCQVLGKFIRSN